MRTCGLWLVVLLTLGGTVPFARGQPIQRLPIPDQLGVCTVDRWKAHWPGCLFEDGVSEGHLSVVRTTAGNAYRVDFAVGQIGPERGGVGWRFPIENSEILELSYDLTFSPDFPWVKGGKLPGLCGGPESVTGGNPADGKNGFSARLMWRADGRGEAYVYHVNQPDSYGESLPFRDDFRFPTGEPCQVKLRVALNRPGQRNGELDVWVTTGAAREPRHVLSRSDLQYRNTPKITIDSVLFQTFHGGSDKSWAPRQTSHALFRDIAIRRFP